MPAEPGEGRFKRGLHPHRGRGEAEAAGAPGERGVELLLGGLDVAQDAARQRRGGVAERGRPDPGGQAFEQPVAEAGLEPGDGRVNAGWEMASRSAAARIFPSSATARIFSRSLHRSNTLHIRLPVSRRIVLSHGLGPRMAGHAGGVLGRLPRRPGGRRRAGAGDRGGGGRGAPRRVPVRRRPLLAAVAEEEDGYTGPRGPSGWYVQRGDGVKAERMSLPATMAPATVDLDRARRLLALPREVGLHPETGEPILAGIGRYGP